MKFSSSLACAVVALGLAIWVTALSGQEKKTEGKDDFEELAYKELSALSLANDLINHGKLAKNPDALVVAVGILKDIPVLAENANPEDKDALKKAHVKHLDEILDAAAEMRPGDKLLRQMIERTRDQVSEASRSTLPAKIIHTNHGSHNVQPNKPHTVSVQLHAGHPTTIATDSAYTRLIVPAAVPHSQHAPNSATIFPRVNGTIQVTIVHNMKQATKVNVHSAKKFVR